MPGSQPSLGRRIDSGVGWRSLSTHHPGLKSKSPALASDHQPSIIALDDLRGALNNHRLRKSAGWNSPGLMLEALWMYGVDSEEATFVQNFPVHLLAGV